MTLQQSCGNRSHWDQAALRPEGLIQREGAGQGARGG